MEDAAVFSHVRAALRGELEARGYVTGRDTAGVSGALYVADRRGMARALFEFMPSPDEAFATMYQGSWVAGLPPRFAVMPLEQAGSPDCDLLQQARIIALFYRTDSGAVGFPELGAALAVVGPPDVESACS